MNLKLTVHKKYQRLV